MTKHCSPTKLGTGCHPCRVALVATFRVVAVALPHEALLRLWVWQYLGVTWAGLCQHLPVDLGRKQILCVHLQGSR